MRLLFFFMLQQLVFAQPGKVTRFDRLTLEEGLSQLTVLCIVQDSKGFLWIGTQDGLNRYDGYEFRIYRNDSEAPSSLSDNYVRSLYEDRAGTLWIGTDGGLNRYDKEEDRFHHFRHDSNDPHSLGNDSIWSIYEDRTGALWLGLESGGLDRYDRENNHFFHFQHDVADPHSLNDNSVLSILEDSTGGLWIGTYGGGLNRYDREKDQFQHFVNKPDDPFSLSHDRVNSIYEDRLGLLWIGTYGGGLNMYDRETGRFERFYHDENDPGSLSHNSIWAIHEDQSGTLWIGTEGGGLNKYDREKKRFLNFRHDASNPHSLSDDIVFSIYEDRTGILWIGTYSGLNKYDREKDGFFHIRHDAADPKSLSYGRVNAIFKDRTGSLWVGTAGGGLNQYDKANDQFLHFQHDDADPQSLANDTVWAILEDKSGELWVGTDAGLAKFDRAKRSFLHFQNDPDDPYSLNSDSVNVIYEDKNEILWIGTYGGGLNRYDRQKKQFHHFLYDPNDPFSLSNSDVNAIFEDRVGNLWIGTYGGGLNRYDKEARHFVQYRHNEADPRSLSNDIVMSIYEDRSGTLWIGTYGGGLNKFQSKGEHFKHFREKHGLANDCVYGIVEDGSGHLWMSTNKGLSRFDPALETFKNYDENDGLQSNEFNQGAFFRTPDGELFFGGVNGLNRFFPEKILDDTQKPPVVFTDFLLFNMSVPLRSTNQGSPLKKAILTTDELTLTYKQNLVTFEFSTLHFKNPKRNQFAYRLEGWQEEWIFTDYKNRRATYSNIPAGTYALRVKASNQDGYWNEAGTSIKLKILPPPWKTWWAYTLYAIALLGLLVWFVRSQRQKVAYERSVSEKLRQVDKLKDAFLANTSHELRTPLNGIIGLAESLLDGVGGSISEKVTHNLSMIIAAGRRLANMVNDLLDFSKMKNHDLSVQKKPIDLGTLTDLVLNFSQSFLAGKAIELRNEINRDEFVLGDENRLQQILFNLIDNAIKFTQKGSILVSAARKGDFVEIRIQDTGKGIPPEHLDIIFESFQQGDGSTSREFGGTGLGLSITKQLVELQGGTISVVSEVNHGSTFMFTLPRFDGVIENASLEIMPINTLKGPDIQNIDTSQNLEMEKNGEYKILIVDDEPLNLQVLTDYLSGSQFQVTSASNGADALARIEKETFDLVVLDIMMPHMSGYQVCSELRKRHLPNELPVLLLTAKNQISDLVTGLDKGANDYLTKPISKMELLARVKTHLNLQKIHGSFSRFIPVEFLKVLGKESIMDVQLGDHTFDKMVVFFSDIRDYTSLAEKMSPADTFRFLNAYLKRVGPILKKYDGFVNQYYGDGIMGIFPHDVQSSVMCAVEIQRTLKEYNEFRKQKGRAPLSIGIGLHYGPLMLGIIGDGKRADTGVVADTVNTTARIEGLTKMYGSGILISETIVEQLKENHPFTLRLLDKVKMKGKENPITIYDVIDGEADETQALMKLTLEDFELGMEAYFGQDFIKAQTFFSKVITTNPNDRAAFLLMSRCHQLMLEGVPKDWNGCYTWIQK